MLSFRISLVSLALLVLGLLPNFAFGQHLAKVRLYYATTEGGTPISGDLALSDLAGPGGFSVQVSCAHDFIPPATITVPEGSRSIVFSIPTSPVPTNRTVALTFSDGTVNQNVTETILKPIKLASVKVSPSSLVAAAGSAAFITIRLTNPAGPYGVQVDGVSSQPTLVRLPTLYFRGGVQEKSFEIDPDSLNVTKTTSVSFTFSYGGITETASLQLIPPFSPLPIRFSSNHMIGGQGSTKGTISSMFPAPAEGYTVSLVTDQECVQVPATVTIPHGKTTAPFTMTTSPVATTTLAQVSITSCNGVLVPDTWTPVVLTPPGLSAGPWPKFMQNSQNTGIAVFDYVSGNPAEWAFQTGGSIESSPVIGEDGTIYVGSDDNKLYAIHPDGTEKWEFPTSGPVVAPPTIAEDGTIYVGSSDGSFYAVHPNGTSRWTYLTNGAITGAANVATDGTVYFGSAYGQFFALTRAGFLKWRRDIPSFQSCTPALGADGTIYVTSTFQLYAINPDGTIKWQTWITWPNSCSPTVALDGTVYVPGYNQLYAFNPDGTQKWTFYSRSPTVGAAGLDRFGNIQLCNTEGTAFVVAPNGTLVWKRALSGPIYASPAANYYGGMYIVDSAHEFYDLVPGASVSYYDQLAGSGTPVSSPAVGNGGIYVGSDDGKLYFRRSFGQSGVISNGTNGDRN